MYKEPGIKIEDEWMDNSAESNSDGFGLSYIDADQGLKVFKTMDYIEFKTTFRQLESSHEDSSFILHFRKTTDGATNVDNCHPFLSGGVAVFHNGLILPCKPSAKEETRSDTRIFAEDLLPNLPNGWLDNEAILDLIEEYIGNSKLAIMDGDGNVVILNENKGNWHEGVWMSNYSFYPNTRSVQRNKPVCWNSNVNKKGEADKGSWKRSKKKHLCYKHPNYTFTKYKDGNRYRWYPESYMWAEVEMDGKIRIAGGRHYTDPPTYERYDIIDVTYGVDLTGIPRAVRVVDNTEEKKDDALADCQCDWCGGYVTKEELTAYGWAYGDKLPDDDDDEVSLVCKSCAEELDIESYMEEKHNANIEYYLQLQRRNGVWNLI
jgi:glutamine amidotransferase